MERAGEFLGRALRRLEHPEAALAWLVAAWPAIVGKPLAARTRPVRCDGGCLEIATDGKAWQKQLEELQREFCTRINQAWGGNIVRKIRFVANGRAPNNSASPGPQHLSRELDNEYTPFVRRGKRVTQLPPERKKRA
jgi:predicted nucleic acid-binding Zn ribbon protein